MVCTSTPTIFVPGTHSGPHCEPCRRGHGNAGHTRSRLCFLDCRKQLAQATWFVDAWLGHDLHVHMLCPFPSMVMELALCKVLAQFGPLWHQRNDHGQLYSCHASLLLLPYS